MKSGEEEYLYHYTTVETLALILKNKTMRFSSLDRVDDLEEVMIADEEAVGEKILVACFTNKEDESIPIWNMYARKGEGVRIRFKKRIFGQEEVKIINVKMQEDKKKAGFILFNEALDVIYTDDKDKLIPSVVAKQPSDEEWSIGVDDKYFNLGYLGVCKRIAWDFQEEVRYRGILISNTAEKPLIKSLEVKSDFKYVDVPIETEIMNCVEITKGYNMTPGNEELLKILVNEYNKQNNAVVKIVESSLSGKVK